jgi:hypothetical protein
MMQAKLKQSKGCACETPFAEVFLFPGNGVRKIFVVVVCDSVNHRPVGNPKRNV